MTKSLETGVDRLVNFISSKKKVTIAEAANELGVSDIVVKEWAEFLADTKLIGIEYGLSKTYLKERELSKKDVENREKDYVDKKDAFIRKVESHMKRLEGHNDGFEKIKTQFDTLKGQIGKQMNSVNAELQELKKFESLKKDLDKDINKEITDYKKQVAQASVAIANEHKNYESLVKQISTEEQHIEAEKEELKAVEKLEADFEKRAKEFEKMINESRTFVKERTGNITSSEKHLDKLKGEAQKIREELTQIKVKNIEPLEAKKREHEEQLEKIRQTIMDKAKETKERINADVAEGEQVVKDFKQFFDKRADTEKLIKDIDTIKNELQGELETLKRSAIGFDVASKKGVKEHIKDLEKKYEKLDKKHAAYRSKLEKLINNVVG